MSRTVAVASGVNGSRLTERLCDVVVEQTMRPAPPTPSTAGSTKSDGEDSIPATPLTPGPPTNFAQVDEGIYRSAFPRSNSFEFMEGLKLKTILTLVEGAYPGENTEFIHSNGILHLRIPIPPNKDTFDSIPLCSMGRALSILMDKTKHPVLVHCNKGKHRTGCVIGCYRKVSDWTMGSILREYRHHAGAKARLLDEKYMELFDENAMRASITGQFPAEAATRRRLLTPNHSPPNGEASRR